MNKFLWSFGSLAFSISMVVGGPLDCVKKASPSFNSFEQMLFDDLNFNLAAPSDAQRKIIEESTALRPLIAIIIPLLQQQSNEVKSHNVEDLSVAINMLEQLVVDYNSLDFVKFNFSQWMLFSNLETYLVFKSSDEKLKLIIKNSPDFKSLSIKPLLEQMVAVYKQQGNDKRVQHLCRMITVLMQLREEGAHFVTKGVLQPDEYQ